MRRILCSYAYDIPYYYDFIVEVPDNLSDKEAEKLAEKRAQQALDEGLFHEKGGDPCFDNADNERVFVSGPETDLRQGGEYDPILEQLAVPVEVDGKPVSFNLKEAA